MISAVQLVARGIRYCRCENQKARNNGSKYSSHTSQLNGDTKSRRKIAVIRTPASGRMREWMFVGFAAMGLGRRVFTVQSD